MSVFLPQVVRCGACGESSERAIAVSVNGGRAPNLRAEILAGTFQRFECPSCGEPTPVDPRFTYVDFGAGQFIGVYPARAGVEWKRLEAETLALYDRNLGAHAPPAARAVAPELDVRVVFGLAALREKLVVFEAGLDDVAVELVKLDLVRCQPGLVFHPGADIRLVAVEEPWLRFHASVKHRPDEDARLANVRAPHAALDGVPMDSDAARMIAGAAFRDLGRLLLPVN